ncbi:MAG: SEC-C domain-containing protein [Lachnospiraceae bacterium]|nr:SEC-C domain-containing protein [Lachnospiraceae bacterium]
MSEVSMAFLKELLEETYTVADLKELAKKLELKGVSKLKKAELAEAVAEAAAEADLTVLTEEERAVFTQAEDVQPAGTATGTEEAGGTEPAAEEAAGSSRTAAAVSADQEQPAVGRSLRRPDRFTKSWSAKTVLKTKKIYPNDPCPCGSGKKYKKCCGRAK